MLSVYLPILPGNSNSLISFIQRLKDSSLHIFYPPVTVTTDTHPKDLSLLNSRTAELLPSITTKECILSSTKTKGPPIAYDLRLTIAVIYVFRQT